MLKRNLKLRDFSLLISFLNFLLFHLPFFKFVVANVDYKTFSGFSIIISLVILMLAANFFTFYLILFLSRIAGKVLLVLFFIINSIAVYFINTYSVIIDESMIGNILNTNYEESSSFFSYKLILYLVILGILPSIFIIKAKIIKEVPKKFLITSSLTLLFMVILAFANASNWLWIDKNSKTLGGLAMPWSYSVNISLFYIHQAKKNQKEILLPDAKIKDTQKSVMVLVIGESARRENFSLYGYKKNTNPLLSKTPGVHSFNATSCATYTTAGVKCILEHKNTDDLYEILPNYLSRNDVDVIWRTTNWGEPPVHIKNYQNKESLEAKCKGEDCGYDGVLLNGLKEEIMASKKNKILIVLHTSTSHGPTYSKKYPSRFETFKPVCNSVELGNCSKEQLINAYDNTIVYTDYILHSIIEDLKQLNGYNSAMMYVSDHGESLGEKNLYMHGVPISIAPKEQYEIPFIVWVSDGSKQLKPNNTVSQNQVFHSVLNFLGVQSPVYNEKMNIFK
ncbi:phosphoethanolamine--lipid A transferase EptA [Elizabethkingia anophelis]|nr:phosphoethanolamine--lipid A transferase EptA [Elizabethkingia anophelis]MCT3695278.1 phosphoethanolamine--lipid A transferase EptA [Elizabethkingia anophelis]MCT3859281.1 phosphoethanolamine--lipid A transferase EptA [Elizabethkingia anophelis]MCT3912593.1 phosphoethanolamine--lipid A transferase EptA [Elizabethkingia anophelis]MCT4215803.1 phosphoethanolamine--lipid A transferase EptA [Elizabethkingia anophelis]